MNKKEKDVKYNIILRYVQEIKFSDSLTKLFKKDIFQNICESEKQKHNMLKTFSFPYKTAMSRIMRFSYNGSGSSCPLILWEDRFVLAFLCMSNMKRPLHVSSGLDFINNSIKDTEMQNLLIKWKLDHRIYYKTKKDLGLVGRNYWRGFMKRNSHRLKSKPGKKFSTDRSNFTTYLNFKEMYDHVEEVMVNDCKVGVKLDEPVWMTENGDIVDDEKDAFGIKVTMDLQRPDMCIVLDEVGCNITQENDGSKGGELFLCGENQVPYQCTATKNCHFTCLGLTTLAGEGLMCVVIVQGKRRDILCKTGIDWTKLNKDDIDDFEFVDGTETEFFTANFGKDAIFPGGPTCWHNGIEIPAYVTFNEHGGMDGKILTEIFRRLDHLKIYDDDRKEGLTPFVLLDGHQSRFDLEFLEYINDPFHKWNVCIGVPYGTSLWQVADSSEQNGLFKMLLNEKKNQIFQYRLSTFTQKFHLVRTDIIPAVNYAWYPAFADRQNNIKAIKARGWYYYCRILLLNPIIRATMTEDMLSWERSCGLFGKEMLKELHDVCYCKRQQGQVSLECVRVTNGKLNFSGGATSQYVANNVMAEVDRQQAREVNLKRKLEGTTAIERFQKITKKLTSGKLVLEARQSKLDINVLMAVKRKSDANKKSELEKKRRAELNYMKQCYNADMVIAKNAPIEAVNWKTKTDIKTYLKPLKRPDDSKMPEDKDELIVRVKAWNCRNRHDTSRDQVVLDEFAKWKTGEEMKHRGKQSKLK